MIKTKSKTKIGWLPADESISETWRELDLTRYGSADGYDLAISKHDAMYPGDINNGFSLKKHKVRKVKVTLTLTIEDIE